MISPNFNWDSYGISRNFFCCLLITLIFSFSFSSYAQLAFPSAQGFGKLATGGRGGTVIKVTNLNDSGAGSLRQALQYTSGPRTIVFEVGGTITLNSALSVTNGNVTVAGQTAPGDGILIKGSMVIVEDSNVIIRYIRFRPGQSAPNNEADALSITAWGSDIVENVIVDHCSMSWAKDENFNIRASGSSGSVRNITVQNSIVSESTYGVLSGGRTYNITFYKNMFAHNQERNIRNNYPLDNELAFEMINNLVFGGLNGTQMSFGAKFTVINNDYKRSSEQILYPNVVGGTTAGQGTPANTYAFIENNIVPNGTNEISANLIQYLETTPFANSGIVPIPANQVANSIMSDVGCSLPNRDAVDIRLINQYNTNTGSVATSGTYPTILGGTAPVDTDDDGMPDAWEIENGLNLNDASDRNIVQPDGYTNLEYYLNGITIEVVGNQVNINASNAAICQGSSTTLTASGADSYIWNTGETSTSIEISPDITTTYTVTGTHSDGSTTQDEITITVNQIPTANAGQDIDICQGTEVILTATGGTSYLWNTGATSASINVSPNITTTFTVEVFENTCSSTDEIIVTVNEIPNIDAGQDQTIFDGESATLTATGADSYLWSTGETTQTISVNPLLDTSYFVTGTTNNCENTDTVTVFLLDDSVAANAGSDMEICNGQTTTLTATGGTTYLWSTGATTASINVSPNTTTIYTVTAFSVSGNNSEDTSVTVTVNEIPVADAGNDIEVCFGNSAILTASGGSSYVWSTGETSQAITVNLTETTIYSVEVFENNCSSTDQVIVIVNALPNVSAGGDVTIVEGASTTLVATGANTYLWSTGETTESVSVTPNTTTVYTVTGFLGDCESSNDVTVSVETETITANAGADVSICNGESTTLTASGGSTYLWSTGETTASISVNPNITTTYAVTAFNASESISDDDSVIVTINELPNTSTEGDVTITEGESTILMATGAESYLWNTGETTTSISVTPNSTTTYTVTGFNNGCESTDDVTVTVEIENVTANAGVEATICNGETITLTASGGSTYLWNTGETTPSISVTPNTTMTYTVTAFNAAETASDDASVTVTVNELPNTSSGSDVTIMEGDSTTLTATGAESYLWNTGETTVSISVTPNVTTTYAVTGFLNDCEFTDETTVTVEPFEFTASAGADQAICQGYETTLTASEGDSYLWSTGETTQSITVNPTNTQTYTVTVFDGAYQDDAEVQVGVNPNPNVIITNGANVMILEGEFITLSAIGANTYSWNNGATQPNIAVSPLNTTTYEVTGFINNCEDTKAIIVNVLERVQADAGEDLFICDEETVTLTAIGGDAYLWNNGETTQTIEVSPDEDTEYSVLVYNALDSDEDTVMVFVEECSSTVEIPVESETFDFMIYQDPTSDILKVRIDGLQSVTARGYYIYDLSGKIIHTETFNPSEMEELSQMTRELDVSAYSIGIYVVRLIYNDTSLIKKIPIR
jgi:hypothetical protein